MTPPGERREGSDGRGVAAMRRLQFCAGHRVSGHESKCKNLHGHNYVVVLHAVADRGLDAVGRVMDFGVLKRVIGGWLEENWDHGFIVWSGDAEAIAAVRRVAGQKLFVLPENPTAENMARWLLTEVCPRLLAGTGVRISRIVLWETENCAAEVEAHGH